MTFGLDDVYDDKAAGTYSTKKAYGQGQNDYQNRNRKPAAAPKPPPPKAIKVVQAKVQAKAKKLLGGWVDQGSTRVAWDDEEQEEE